MWVFALSPNGGQIWCLVRDSYDTAKLIAHAYILPRLDEAEYFHLYHSAHMNERGTLESN